MNIRLQLRKKLEAYPIVWTRFGVRDVDCSSLVYPGSLLSSYRLNPLAGDKEVNEASAGFRWS